MSPDALQAIPARPHPAFEGDAGRRRKHLARQPRRLGSRNEARHRRLAGRRPVDAGRDHPVRTGLCRRRAPGAALLGEQVSTTMIASALAVGLCVFGARRFAS